MTNHLYYGDNLMVLRDSIKDESVDLIYLDPPFNSKASYNVLFKGPQGDQSAAQIEAFDDTWHWNDSAEEAFGDVIWGQNAAASTMLGAMWRTAQDCGVIRSGPCRSNVGQTLLAVSDL